MTSRIAVLALLATLVAGTAGAAQVELVSDNDTNLYVPGAGTFDRNYTQGARVAWYGEPDVLPARVEAIAAFVPALRPFARDGEPRTRRFGVLVGQEIYTPDAISRTRRITNDRPYAGWLYASAFVTAADEHRFRALQAGAGMVGPSSGAAEVQTWWHSQLGIRVPRGWQWQLRDEPGVFVRWEERARPWGRRRFVDLVPHAGATLGNVSTEAHAGATVRLGCRCPTTSTERVHAAGPGHVARASRRTCSRARGPRGGARPVPGREHVRSRPARDAGAAGGRVAGGRGRALGPRRAALHVLVHDAAVPRAHRLAGIRLDRPELLTPSGAANLVRPVSTLLARPV